MSNDALAHDLTLAFDHALDCAAVELQLDSYVEGFARSPAVLCAPRHWTTVFAISPRLVALFAQFPTRTEAE